MRILPPVECRKGLTFSPVSAIMLITMAEVAGSISTVFGLAIAEMGKGTPPKELSGAERLFLGLRRTCAKLSSLRMERRSGECGCCALCRSDTGYFVLRRLQR